MRRILLPVCAILFFAAALAAQVPVLSVSDFTVESDNPSYKFIGKGLSTLLAGELRKSAKAKLIEREQLNKILEAQEMSLSDLTDPKDQIQIGKLLSAQFLIVGQMIDMAGNFIISVRMVDTTTGEIVWEDNLNAKLDSYDYIGAYFAKSILTHFGASSVASIDRKIEAKQAKREDAIIALASGVDAFDRNDTAAAKTSLEKAKALDPVSEVAAYYLAKIVLNTTKFQIAAESYYTFQNPAYLSLLKTDKLYFGMSVPVTGFTGPAYWDTLEPYVNSGLLPDGKGNIQEFFANGKLGYAFPLADGIGLQVDAMFYAMENRVWDASQASSGLDEWGTATWGVGGYGAMANLGVRLMPGAALGFGFTYYGQTRKDSFPFNPDQTATIAGNAGLLFHNADRSVMFDTRFGYTSGMINLIDVETFTLEPEKTNSPLYNENTLVLAFDEHRTFFNLKETNEVMLDGSLYYIRILPAVERFLSDGFALRAGAEGSFALLDGTANYGFGGIAGATLRFIPAGLDFDVNVSYRFRPSRVVAGLLYPDFVLLFIVTKNGVFMK